MIACAARTGSTMLVRALRSHPALVVHGEVWGARMVGLDGPLARACEADPAALEGLERARFEDPEAGMRRFLDPHGALAAGFKLKFDELVRPEWSGVRRLVEGEGGVDLGPDLPSRYQRPDFGLQGLGDRALLGD